MSDIAKANEQARDLREVAERRIADVLRGFQNETGLSVNGVEIVRRSGPVGVVVKIEAGLNP